MLGFDVTPTTASSSISPAIVPSRSQVRETESTQTLCPWSDSSCRRDLAMCFLHFLDLLEPSYVALAAVEPRTQEYPDELGGKLGADDLRAQAEHVHVVVLDALVRGVDVVADGRANPGDLAGGNRRADAGAADQDAAVGAALAD